MTIDRFPVTFASTEHAPTLDEIHITLEQFEDEISYEDDGTAVLDLAGIRHRCPAGTPCHALSQLAAAKAAD